MMDKTRADMEKLEKSFDKMMDERLEKTVLSGMVSSK